MSHRLHVAPESMVPGTLLLGGADFRYLARVLRLGPGAELTLFDGTGREAPARIVAVDAGASTIELAVASPEARRDRGALSITLLCALLKAEKMDWVVQKATELGAARIVPLSAKRSVVRLDPARAASRVIRWRKIAREAARQCDRADTPEIEPVATLGEAVAAAPAGAWKAIFHEGSRATSLKAALPPDPPSAAVVAVGPEGGFDAGEIDTAAVAGFAVIGMGPRVLRAETAAIAALAMVGYALGDLG